MNNSDIKYALKFHEQTKHSEFSMRISSHYLDWNNRPKPFKVYTKLPSISLPRGFPLPAADALTSISSVKTGQKPTGADTAMDSKMLAEILFFSAGITRETKHDSGTYYMRAASATGALYPIELYAICRDMPGLRGGVYHFCPADFSLTELRKGDCRAELAAFNGGNNDLIMSAPVTLAFTSIAWRNAWKYQTRSYRHWFWDAGVIAANLLATTASLGLPTRLSMGFADAEVNRFLYLEEGKEAAVALATIGIDPAAMESRTKEASIAPHNKSNSKTTATGAYPEILPLSQTEIEYPEIWVMHTASSLANREQARAWVNSSAKLKKLGGPAKGERGKNFMLPRLSSRELSADTEREEDTLGRVILRRGSTRRFARSGISLTTLSTILHSSTSGIPLDFLQGGESVIQIYLIANAVDSLHPGRYFFSCAEGCLEQLEKQEDAESSSRNMSQYLCLGQPLFGDASAVFFLMCDLQKVLSALGNRGYGAAQFEAGVIAGKIYLAAYAQGIGASGSTFYDDAVTEFFSPHAGGKSTMIAVGVGVPAYRARPGKIFAGRQTRAEHSSSSPEGLA